MDIRDGLRLARAKWAKAAKRLRAKAEKEDPFGHVSAQLSAQAWVADEFVRDLDKLIADAEGC